MRSTRRVCLAAAVLFVIPSAPTWAQPPGRGFGGDALRSVEVGPDRKVTFRIRAPKASEVSVGGDFGGGKLAKNEQGVWSVTLGPLEPDLYSYAFTVDGVRTIDARNPMIKPGLMGLDNVFFVPGDASDFEAIRDVPHGEVRTAWYRSSTLGMQRRLHVYTPPGYETSSDKYPVLYLLHGAGDDDQGWSTIGRAGFILDNLLADKKTVPFVVVMPNGSLPMLSSTNLPRPTPGQPPSAEMRARFEAMQNRFTDELLKDIVPFVEATYRVKTGQASRAIAGLSMGGGQTWRVVSTHPDQFAYVGLWSAALFGQNNAELESRYAEFLAKTDLLNASVKVFSISCGEKDGLVVGSKALDELLTAHKIRHELHISGGGHTWINWRHYLNELAPKLFR